MVEVKEIIVSCEIEDMDHYLKKAEKYVELLREAKSLAAELASINFSIETRS